VHGHAQIKRCLVAGVRHPNHKVERLTDKWPTGLKNADELSAALKGMVSPERICELADAGYLPHYRIDGGPPAFVITEAKAWLAENILETCEGRSMATTIRVCVAAPDPIDSPPASILNVPSLQQIPASEYQPGVYFLCKGADVVYVGQSVAPASRIATHAVCPSKDFDRAYLLPVPASDLDEVEAAFIKTLNPSQQGRHRSGTVIAPASSVPIADTIKRFTTKERQHDAA